MIKKATEKAKLKFLAKIGRKKQLPILSKKSSILLNKSRNSSIAKDISFGPSPATRKKAFRLSKSQSYSSVNLKSKNNLLPSGKKHQRKSSFKIKRKEDGIYPILENT